MLADLAKEKVAWDRNRNPPRPTSSRLSQRARTALLLAAICSLWFFALRTFFRTHNTSTGWTRSPRSPYAIATFLAQNPDHENKTVPDHEDAYYVATRTLAYQLLHAPETRTNTFIPFIVMATHDIAPHKIARLEQDGAIVKVVESIKAPWMKPGSARWRDMLDKLHLFTMTEYKKILFLDADTLVIKRLDSIFTDPTTSSCQSNPSRAREDEGPIPDFYTISAQAAFESQNHNYPPSEEESAQGHLSAGFFLAAPCKKLFNYYLNLLKLEGRFRDNAMEQDLLNYAHRRDGPMPWTDITYTWTTTWPTMKEYKAGAATLHEKFWVDRTGLDFALRKLWYTAMGEMTGYWLGKELK